MSLSLDKGEPVYLDKVDSIADGLSAPFVGKHTLAHVQALVDDMVIVSDDEIRQAMALIIERCKVLAEPAASAGLAALLTGKIRVPNGCTVVCLLSGGNIDHERLKSLL
jgi:threonine dehydratase